MTIAIKIIILFATIAILNTARAEDIVDCGRTPSITIEVASKSFQERSEFESMLVLFCQLSLGMDRADVIALLGEPHYSPVDGQDNYYSNRKVMSSDSGLEVPIGLVIDYRDFAGFDYADFNDRLVTTTKLQKVSLRMIAE